LKATDGLSNGHLRANTGLGERSRKNIPDKSFRSIPTVVVLAAGNLARRITSPESHYLTERYQGGFDSFETACRWVFPLNRRRLGLAHRAEPYGA
jgi:hypothetical protein